MSLERDRETSARKSGGQDSADFGSLISSWAQNEKSSEIEARRVFAAIQTQLIPRLVLARESYHRSTPSPALRQQAITREDRELFLRHVLRGGASEASALAKSLISRGTAIESVFVDLLAWTARQLGEYWEEDRCTFTDVTIALCRLHEVLHQVSEAGGAATPRISRAEPSILISSVPGDQHVFGALMVAESFRRDGWLVLCEPGNNTEKLRDTVKKTTFDVVGLSCACDRDTAELTELINAVRTHSSNRNPIVMVGGRLFIERPELAKEVGADLVAKDGASAVKMARNRLAYAAGDC